MSKYEWDNHKDTDFTEFERFFRDSNIQPIYDTRSDYTTNAPSFYEYLARHNHLIKLLAKRIYDYDKELAKRFLEWDKRIENLPEELQRMFLEWVDDGTLARILAQLLLEDYATKQEVNDLITVLENDLKLDIDNLKNELNNKINDNFEILNNNLNNHVNIYNDKNDHFIINVDEFKGTDHFIIQSALNKARDNGGGTVYVPSRLYELDNELIIYSNTTLWCETGAILKRMKSGYILMNGERDRNYKKYSGNGNIRIINGTYDGNAQSSNVGLGSNIVIAHAENVLIENVIIKNSNSHHIELNSSRNVEIKNCKFLGASESHTFQEALQLDLSTKGGFSSFGEHDNTPCENVYIINNYFGRSKELPPIARAIGTHATRIGAPMKNIFIEDNIFDECRDWGIQLLSYHDTFIKNNIFRKCTGGIIIYPVDSNNPKHMIDIYDNVTTTLQNSKNILIENNTFNEISGKQIIYLYGRSDIDNEDIRVLNNIINNSVNVSGVILFHNVKNGEISGNKIYNVGKEGISLKTSKYINISNNNLSYIDGYAGIRLQDKSQVISISNNLISYVQGNGIEINNECHNNVISNNIFIFVSGYSDTENLYYGIYTHSNCQYLVISGNIFRTFNSGGYVYENAIYLTNTITNIRVTHNIAQKGTGEKYVFTGASESVNNNF